MRVRRVGDDAGVGQCGEDRADSTLRKPKREELLAYQQIVVLDTAQCVAIGLSWRRFVSGGGPGWGRDLHDQVVAIGIPYQHDLRVPPRRGARCGAAFDLRVFVELVVPDNVIEVAIVYRIERGAYGVRGRVTQTGLSPIVRFLEEPT